MPRTRDEAAKDRVLDSARSLVREFGPSAVTADEIASAAGVGKQTIVHMALDVRHGPLWLRLVTSP